MKNRIIFGIIMVFIIISFVLIIERNDIYHLYVNHKIEKKVIKELNGEFDENTDNFIIMCNKVFKKSNEELNHYDITKLIDVYLDVDCDGVRICSIRNNGEEVEYGANKGYIRSKNFERGKDIIMDYNLEYGYSEDYDENDIINYKNGSFRNLLIEKLKTILDYEEKDGKIIWQINSVNDEVIELPNNFYLDYISDKTIKNDRFKKAIDVVIDEKFSYKKKDNITNKIIVRYETNDGKIDEKKVEVLYFNGEYEINPINIYCLYLGDDAKVCLCNHTCDKVVEEKMREYELNDDFEPDSYR